MTGYLVTCVCLVYFFFSLACRQICSLLRGGIAERGGVRVGHRIIEINGQSVVAVPHERIVGLLATSVGEVRRSFLLCRHYLLQSCCFYF